MKLLSMIFVALLFLISGCDNSRPIEKKEVRPSWGQWLPSDVEHPEKRLEVKFGDVLYQIPQSYLVGGESENRLDDYSSVGVDIVASYPDLIPGKKMNEQHVPQFPRIEVILSGHKDDPNKDIKNWEKRKYEPMQAPDPALHCVGPVVSQQARGMSEYICNPQNHLMFFTPTEPSITTPIGHKLFIKCNDDVGLKVRYRCQIVSFLFNDPRGAHTRIYLNDLSSLLNVYHKTLELLVSLEAPNQ